MKGILNRLKYNFILTIFAVIKLLINFLTILTIVHIKSKKNSKLFHFKAAVYLITDKKHYFEGIRAILSFHQYFPDVIFKVIDDGSLTIFAKWLIQQLNFSVDLIDKQKQDELCINLKKYQNISKFIKNSWCGKKFIFPLMEKSFDKIIIIDSDTLYFKEPYIIRKWLNSKNPSNLFMKDYENFSNISIPEAKEILGHIPQIYNVNSGIVCLNLFDYFKQNNFETIDHYIKQIILIVKQRLLLDLDTNNDFLYVPHLLEQTLFWLTLDNSKAKVLPQDYFIMPLHRKRGQKIFHPTMIHYAGSAEPINILLYKYSFVSLLMWLQNKLLHHSDSIQPWFTFSQIYCFRCTHLKASSIL